MKHTANERRLSRRRFLTMAGALLAGMQAPHLFGVPGAHAEQPTQRAYLPFITRHFPRVVHTRDPAATSWDGAGAFYEAVQQDAVNDMVLAGLQPLTGQTAWSDIWGILFKRVQPSGYQAGQKIAIKVNFNNGGREGNGCENHNNQIDALPQPLLALVSGMVEAGVQVSDIFIYDATYGGEATSAGRIIPNYFCDPITDIYDGVSFIGQEQELCPEVIPASHGKDPSLTIQFDDPGDVLSDRQLADVLYDAKYVIDVPILKRHSGNSLIPTSLALKNHLGSIDRVVRTASDSIHRYLKTNEPLYRATYSPLVEIYSNSHIRDKTVLIMGDGLFGASSVQGETLTGWNTFGDALNSLFFATDPVAIDCVMTDLLVAEGLITTAHAYDPLFCAAEADLGVCEGSRNEPGGNPWQQPYGSGYKSIQYIRRNL